jgi:hypothetical protein
LPTLLEDANIKIYASDSADNDWFGYAISLYGIRFPPIFLLFSF